MESTVGGVCSVVSPFDGGAKVRTVAGTSVAISKLPSSGPKLQFSFQTEAGNSYVISAAVGYGVNAASAPAATIDTPTSAATL